ncbi:MAG: hypothetical protein H6757_00090 [Candidatus Omnitrophica bacterium]|nr:hypothetical protein [Candidatus Omnitrophota bacterium]
MSLKAFHIFFIVLSIILAAGFGGWAIRDFSLTHSQINLGLGIFSLIGAAALTGYLPWFLSKTKNTPAS